jgi:Lhr-like helicase
MGRKNEAEIAVRQTDVRDMLLKGKSTSHIIAYVTNTYSIGKSTVERDITIVYRELRRYLEKAKDDIISEHIAKYDKIFEDCMDVGNVRDALKAMRQKEELLKYHRNEPLIAIQNNTMNFDNVFI